MKQKTPMMSLLSETQDNVPSEGELTVVMSESLLLSFICEVIRAVPT